MGARLALDEKAVDDTLAVDLAEKGCALGETFDVAESCNALARVYEAGLKGGDPKLEDWVNYNAGLVMGMAARERACMLKHAKACDQVAAHFMYSQTPDFPRAAAAAKMGCSLRHQAFSGSNCDLLGKMYESGQLGEIDLKMALSLFEQGCARGAVTACGNGAALAQQMTPDDLDSAKAMAEKGCAIDAGFDSAGSCFFLGMNYRDGSIGTKDGQPDLQAALFYFQKGCLFQFSVACDLASQLLAGNSQLADPDGARFFAQRACDNLDCRVLGSIYAAHGAGKDDVGTTAHYLQLVVRQSLDYDPNIFGALAKDKDFFAQVISEIQRNLGLPITGRYGPEIYQVLTFGRRFAQP